MESEEIKLLTGGSSQPGELVPEESHDEDLPSILEQIKSSGLQVDPSDVEHIVLEVLPYHGDNKKARYLGYRACGFAYREACQLTPVHEKSVCRWRATDPTFKQWEDRIPELRKKISAEFITVEFMRNYKAILEKDFQVIMNSLKGPLGPAEQQYLMKARGHYTPTQLETLQVLMGKSKGKAPTTFNFTQFITALARGNGDAVISGGEKGGPLIE